MGLCNKEGCNQPRHVSLGGYEFSYCHEHMREQLDEDKREEQPTEDDMKSKICKKAGCDQPRMVSSSSGVLQTYCEEHQREYWRNSANKNYKSSRPRTTQPPKSVGQSTDHEPTPQLIPQHEYVIGVDPARFDGVVVVQPQITDSLDGNHPPQDCDHCTAKATLEALRGKSPKLAKLIDAMQAEVEASQELGL